MKIFFISLIIIGVVGLFSTRDKLDKTLWTNQDGDLFYEREPGVYAPILKNCSGSWPDPTWTQEMHEKKAKAVEECEKKFGSANQGITWE